jgi:hypothetical protein
MRRVVKILVAGVVGLGLLAFLANFMSVTAVQIYNWSKPPLHAKAHLQPYYADADWAQDHFAEYRQLSSAYEAFYGWRYRPFRGRTIEIGENGLRRTFASSELAPRAIAAFFGGSAMWGTGARDDETIPSFFVKKNSDFEAINFGQFAYVAHQSLNLFLEHYFSGFRPDLLISYDGVHEVGKCHSELDPYSHRQEFRFRTVLDESGTEHPESYMSLVLPTQNLFKKLSRVLQSKRQQSFYDCDQRPAKADAVARGLLSDWRIFKNIVEGYGGRYLAFLQPVAYLSRTGKDHVNLNPEAARQYQVIYARIPELLEAEFPDLRSNFVNLERALDVDGDVYLDKSDLTPTGNEIVAARVTDAVRERTGLLLTMRDGRRE